MSDTTASLQGMSTNPTTPQPRVNKLGHVVTKHVLTNPASPALKTALPAPVALLEQTAPIEPRDAKIDRLIVELNIGALYGEDSDIQVREALNGFGDTTLDLISTTAAWHRSKFLPRLRFMFSVLTELDEPAVREVISMTPLFLDDLETGDIIGLSLGLRHVGHFNGQKLEDLTGRDRELAADLINVAAGVYVNLGVDALEDADDEDSDSTRHVRSDLADLIASNPGQAVAIRDFIRDRDSADAELIREYLQIGVLREGVL